MPPRRHLNLVDQSRALAWLQDGIWLRVFAARLGCSHSVIVRLRQRFQAIGSVQTTTNTDINNQTVRNHLHDQTLHS